MARSHGMGAITKGGHIQVSIHDTIVMQHRLVWMQHNGPIPKGMVIHHINMDKQDNRIENLQLLEHEEHNKIHKGYQKIDGVWWKHCHWCGEFKPITDYYKHGNSTRPECNKCTKKEARRRYTENKERIREYNRVYRENNKELYQKHHRKAYEINKLKTGIVKANLLYSYLITTTNTSEETKPCQITA